MTFNLNQFIALAFIIAIITGCEDKEDEARDLGFANIDEMNSIFAKGYQTKQKYLEMKQLRESQDQTQTTQNITTQSPQTENSQTVIEPVSEKQTHQVTQTATQPLIANIARNNITSVSSSNPINYNSPATQYVVEMILHAADDERKVEAANMSLQSLPKIPRGDKKIARGLNDSALVLIHNNKQLEAIPILESAYQADPGDVEITNNLASAYISAVKDGDYSKAKGILVESLALKPDRFYAWNDLGRAFAYEGNMEFAKNCYINSYRFAKNKERRLQVLQNVANEENKVLHDAMLEAANFVINNLENHGTSGE
jgi:tetratricopeptide (TPR) repeat protein